MSNTQTAEVLSTEMSQFASEISARIANLESLFEQPLRSEMDDLKRCLIENPSAAALMKDEDVGLLVKNLRRTVDAAILEANKPKEKKTAAKKTKQLSLTDMLAAKDDGFPE